MNRKMSNGEAMVCTVVFMFVFLLIWGFIIDATEPKCIKVGCDNKQAEGSSYCYLHKLYSGSGSHKSKTSSYSNGSKGSSTTSSAPGSKSSTSSNRSNYSSGSYSSYDDGYEDVYENDDYDWDRYYSDDDYADGVDDAMDELDW